MKLKNETLRYITITLIVVLLLATIFSTYSGFRAAHAYRSGYEEGLSDGQSYVKNNIVSELKQIGVSHIDIMPHGRVYIAQVKVMGDKVLPFKYF